MYYICTVCICILDIQADTMDCIPLIATVKKRLAIAVQLSTQFLTLDMTCVWSVQ
jgi:hypothetical protein